MKHLYLLSTLLLLALISCKKELKPATVVIRDPVRHYYPVIQGDILDVVYEIENTSDNPLFIKEVQTTCGCLIPRDELPIVILPHKFGSLRITFNSIKNTGYVCHYVYCYGNFRDTTCVEMQFDTNVVPSADYIRDYEQLWHEQSKQRRTIRNVVDGEESQKGYYTEDFVDPRNQHKEEIQNEIDRHAL